MFRYPNLVLIILMSILCSCEQSKSFYIYSIDKSQCITVIHEKGFRFIIEGKHSEIPKTNFIKLDVRSIDPLGDAIHVCWKTNKYEWEVVVDNSKIIESKLDTTKFNFKTILPKDKRGIPTELKFRMPECMIFSYYLMRLSPDEGGIVETL